MSVQETLKVHVSQHGIPCLWESGGRFTHTGSSMIIANHSGGMKRALYIKKEGHRACLEHALIPIRPGDILVTFSHHREKAVGEIFKILSIDGHLAADGNRYAQVTRLALGNAVESEDKQEWLFDWDYPEVADQYEAALDAAIDKADAWHCRDKAYCLEPQPHKHDYYQPVNLLPRSLGRPAYRES